MHAIHTASHVDHEKSCMVFDFYAWMWLCFYSVHSINCFRKNGRHEKVHGLRLLYTFRDVLHPSKINCLLYTVETLTCI